MFFPPNKPFRFLLPAYLLILLVLVLFPFSSVGVEGLNNTYVVKLRLDHLLHVLAFVPLYPLLVVALKPRGGWHLLMVFILACALAVALEGVQYFVDYRSFNPMDMLANGVGVVVGAVVSCWLFARSKFQE
ncbi:MAG: VanZ family protein [Bacteroidales bacterium]